ncbi:GMC family oxidoreductase [Nonomuraea sp. NPDC050328]|uniref:GMC family oxidoreductase n=1 Tax=Nonomuraea sp. NPDC050328 TaxID=3364361 RepID=UPI0037A1D504
MEYDYVIVGAGSAGCVLANRLSADPAVSVALVEAGGPDDKLEIRIPAGFPKLFKTAYDWDYTTAKQPEMLGRELYWPRGRMLGGSSSLNAQMWVRGCALDYDQWGLPGWTYEDVLPYFRKAERRVGSNHGGVYGEAGPLYISEQRSPNVMTGAFLRACEELGMRRLDELNGRSNEGCCQTPVTQNRGRRWSAADAYLKPVAKRPNLKVITGAEVERVLFEGGRAVGVRHGGTTLGARREVILAAGAIGSPLLLLKSGVGPAEDLAAEGVEVVHDLPEVGRNLQDHLASGVMLTTRQPVSIATADSLPNLLRFVVLRSGPFTTNVGEAVAFIRTTPDEPAPDIELIFAPGPFVNHGLDKPTGHGLTVAAVLLQPESRGRVTLSDGKAVVDPGYLTAPADVERLVAGLKTAKKILATDAMRPYAGGPYPPYTNPRTDEELAQWVREKGETLYHPVGTCRMGADAASVVDPELRVRGVDRLRVADASIMPTLNRGHTHAPVIMIGEKAADLIGT